MRAFSSGIECGRCSSGKLCKNNCNCRRRRLYSAAAFIALAGPEEDGTVNEKENCIYHNN